MPQVSDRFGPIYASVVLDGSGNGQVAFQAQGSNIRITNLFVKVSTAVNQANCSMYKGQVADANLISYTNSGSTGAAAHGAIDLFDGENCIVRWIGGDAGATATATFVGTKLNFSERPTSTELVWDDPIAAADGSLVYPAMKSPNFVPGVSGWRVTRQGNVEFNDATIRGTLEAGGGTVRLSNSGLHVDGANEQFDINTTAGFLTRARPDDGSNVQIAITQGFFGDSNGGSIFMSTDSPSANGNTMSFGLIGVEYDVSGATDRPLMTLHGVHVSGKQEAVIDMWGQRSSSANDDSLIDLQAETVNVKNDLTYAGSFAPGKFINGAGFTSNSASIGATETSVLTVPSSTFMAGHAYSIKLTGMVAASVAANNPVLRFRKTNPAGTQIDAWRVYCNNLNAAYNAHFEAFMWIGGSDVTASIVLTLQGSAGFNAFMNGGAGSPYSVTIWDAGDAANVSGWATQLT